MPAAISEFTKVCIQQDVNYTSDVFQQYTGLHPRDDPVWLVLQHVGRRLRKSPGEVLADRPIRGEELSADTATSVLRTIINCTVEQTPSNIGLAFFECSGASTLGYCTAAESDFYLLARHIELQAKLPVEDRTFQNRGCEIFTFQGVPLLLRKSTGNPSSLSLANLAVNRVIYPRGSFFRVDTVDDLAKGGDPKPDKNSLRVLDISEIAKISFGRLSLMAFRPDERPGLHGGLVVDAGGYTGPDWDWLDTVRIEDIQQNVNNIL